MIEGKWRYEGMFRCATCECWHTFYSNEDNDEVQVTSLETGVTVRLESKVKMEELHKNNAALIQG